MQNNVLMDGALFRLVPEKQVLDTVKAVLVCHMAKLTRAAPLQCEKYTRTVQKNAVMQNLL